MKNFKRKNQYLSLCGLNCRLCPMYLGMHCMGCGNGNQSCKIAKCSLENGNVEYCHECKKYPCKTYDNIDAYDSFISHRNQMADLKRAKEIGIDQYNQEQMEKAEILQILLLQYNDGRKKTFFSVAVNVIPLTELKEIMQEITRMSNEETLVDGKKCKLVYEIFEKKSKELGFTFTLRKKIKTTSTI